MTQDSTEVIRLGDRVFSTMGNILAISGVDVDDLTEVSWGSKTQEIEHVRILKSSITSVEGIENISKLKKIEVFETQINDIDALKHCKSLQNMNISEIGTQDISALGSLEQLRDLDASRNKIEVIPTFEAPLLKSLNLSHNQISSIQGLEHLICLESLDLDNNQISEISGLDTLLSLKHLFLRKNQISKIQGLGSLSYCREIRLNENPIAKELRYHIVPEELVKTCGGSLVPLYKLSRDIPNVIQLEHGILSFNDEYSCLYCGSSVSSGKSEHDRCAEEISKRLQKAEKLIPRTVKGKMFSVGQKPQFYSRSLGHGVWDTGWTTVEDKKRSQHIISERLRGHVFESISGTLCSDCRKSFNNKVEGVLRYINELKGEIKKLEKKKRHSLIQDRAEGAVRRVLFFYGILIDNWIEKAVLRHLSQG